MPMFNPKPSQIRIGRLHSEKGIRYEEDHYLYFDKDTSGFFVVEETEHDSGPKVSCNYSIQDLKGINIELYLKDHPDLMLKAKEFIKAHKPKS